MFTITKKYALVNATSRFNTDLRPYFDIINTAANASFGNSLVRLTVKRSCFIIRVRSEDEKIKHGLLVNFGKNIARQASSLCESAMRVYQSEKHPTSRQLFKCISNTCHS